jgi:hypothetical protein
MMHSILEYEDRIIHACINVYENNILVAVRNHLSWVHDMSKCMSTRMKKPQASNN